MKNAFLGVLALALTLAGCGTSREMSEVRREKGVRGGQDIDVVTTVERRERTQIDLALELEGLKRLVQTGLAAVSGNLPGAVAALIPKAPPPPSADELADKVVLRTGTGGGWKEEAGIAFIGLLAWLREFLSKGKYKKLVFSELPKNKGK